MRITFDEAKRVVTVQRRGLDFADAVKVFAGVVLEYEDERFDYGEVRQVTVGLLYGSVVVIVSADEAETRRIISMRLATKGEQDEYFRRLG